MLISAIDNIYDVLASLELPAAAWIMFRAAEGSQIGLCVVSSSVGLTEENTFISLKR